MNPRVCAIGLLLVCTLNSELGQCKSVRQFLSCVSSRYASAFGENLTNANFDNQKATGYRKPNISIQNSLLNEDFQAYGSGRLDTPSLLYTQSVYSRSKHYLSVAKKEFEIGEVGYLKDALFSKAIDISNTMIDWRVMNAQLKILVERENSLKNSVHAYSELAKSKVVDYADYLLAQADLSGIEASIAETKNQIQNSSKALDGFFGDIDWKENIPDSDPKDLQLHSESFEREIVGHNPGVVGDQRYVAGFLSTRSAYEFSILPDLDIKTQYYNAGYSSNSTAYAPQYNGYAFTVNLTWTIWDGDQRHLENERAKTLAENRGRNVVLRKDALKAALEFKESEIDREGEVIRENEVGVLKLQKVVESYKEKLKIGKLSYFQYQVIESRYYSLLGSLAASGGIVDKDKLWIAVFREIEEFDPSKENLCP